MRGNEVDCSAMRAGEVQCGAEVTSLWELNEFHQWGPGWNPKWNKQRQWKPKPEVIKTKISFDRRARDLKDFNEVYEQEILKL